MLIKTAIVPCSEIIALVIQTIITEYKIEDEAILERSRKKLKQFFEALREEEIYLVCEYPYVDKIYRDSYYHYYSSKFGTYPKESIRLSFFDYPVKMEDFYDEDCRENLQRHFLGFLVIRPTFPFIIGRNVINPRAFKESKIQVCLASFSTTVNGAILRVEGFPHSSQDRETITCAETSLWAVMDYFSARYPDYTPLLPSRISSILNLGKVSYERSLPSRGMRVEELSFVLRELGFGPRIYTQDDFSQGVYLKESFTQLLSCYVESGIPVILSLKVPGKARSGHAVVCIGHKPTDYDMIPDSFTPDRSEDGNVDLYDHDRLPKRFIFSDDNMPPYFQGNLDEPYSGHYKEEWKEYRIDAFVVPLYRKVYLEAYFARQYIREHIFTELVNEQSPVQLYARFFLASSRSYKNHTTTNRDMPELLKNAILYTSLPRFIWVCELGPLSATKQQKAEGVIVLDATEANFRYSNPLILSALNGKLRNFAGSWDKLVSRSSSDLLEERIPFEPKPFMSYQRNLQSIIK